MGVPAARNAGFTLIEMMVVVVLIGIIITFATLSVRNDGDRETELEAQRLAALVSLAGEEAVLKSREVGVLFEREGYRFLVFSDDTGIWQPLEDEVFRKRTLPEGFLLRLSMDGLPVDITKPPESPVRQEAKQQPEEAEQDSSAAGKQEENVTPHIFLLSSGERSPFEVDLGLEEGRRYRIVAPVVGDLQVSGVEEL